jgi:chromosome partitioning protein
MNVISLVSCKAGTGKTTLTTELAAYGCSHGRRCLVIDADPDGGFASSNGRRAAGALPRASISPHLDRQIEVAELLGYDWLLIDTAPTLTVTEEEAIRVAGVVLIPARPGLADLLDVSRTVDLVHGNGKRYAVVLNGVPVGCDGADAVAVVESRAWLERNGIPVWAGQISERPGYVLAEGQPDTRSLAALEIAELWSMIDRSVAAMHAVTADASGEKRAA